MASSQSGELKVGPGVARAAVRQPGPDRAVVLVLAVSEIRPALADMLESPDVEVVTALSERDAFEVLNRRHVTLTIIEVTADTSRFGLLELIRNGERSRRVPILFVTAGPIPESMIEGGKETNPVDILFRPVDERVLRAKVDVLIAFERERRRAERARAETELLLRLARATSQSERAEDIYDLALDAVRDLLDARRSAILLLDDSGRMRFRAWRGLSASYRAAVDGHSPWAPTEKAPRPLLISDVTQDPGMAEYRSIFAVEHIGAIGFVPLVSDHLLGKFMLYWEEPRSFSEHDEALAVAFASEIAEALTRSRWREAERRSHDRLARLQRVTATLNGLVSPEAIGESCLPELCEATGAVKGALWMLSADDREFELMGLVGVPDERPPTPRVPAYTTGLLAGAIRSREPVFIESQAEYERRSGPLEVRPRAPAEGSSIVIPLLVQDRGIGAIGLELPTWRTIPADEREFLLAVADQYGQALDRARLYASERRARERVQAAQERRAAIQLISDAALGNLEVDPLLTEMLGRVRRVFSCDTATILLLDSTRCLEVRASDGIEREAWDRVAVPYGAGVAGAIVADGRSRVVDDVARAHVASPVLKHRLSSMAGVPIMMDGTPIGVLHIGAFQPRRFTQGDLELLQMVAARAAVALERANAYDALRLAEEKLRVALTAGRMGVWEWSVPTGRVTWSPTLEAIHGLEAGTFAGTFEAYQADVHPEDKEELLRTVRETLESRREHHVEYRIVLPDGEVRWVAGHGNVVAYADGEPASMMGVCMDITERKRAEQALRDSEARYRALFEAAVHGIVTIDEEGIVETANPAAERIFGHRAAELVGRNVNVLMPEPYRSEHDTYLENYRRTGRRKIIGIGREVAGRRKDGSEFPVDLAVSEFRVGAKRYFMGILRDVTERRRLERAREDLVAELEQTLRYNEIFAGVLAHDLRNPLGAMMLAAQAMILRLKDEGDGGKNPLHRILSSGRRMARMIDQLLDFTRIRVGGGFHLEPRPADLARICAQVVGELELMHPEWRLKAESRGDLNGTWDEDRLLQVVSNLLTNAAQHGVLGTEILLRLDGTDPNTVTLEVHNQGAIPEALLPNLFAPFRGTRERGESSSGLGLGAYITREVVRSHGGTVDVTSSEAQGTTFTVRLPRRTARPHRREAAER